MLVENLLRSHMPRITLTFHTSLSLASDLSPFTYSSFAPPCLLPACGVALHKPPFNESEYKCSCDRHVFLLTTKSVLMPAEHRRPDPSSPGYQMQVVRDMQKLLAGRRPRNPECVDMTTGRLVLEGVVENARIYRLHQEAEARKAKEKEKRRKHEHGRGHHRGRSHDRRGDHRGRSGEQHRRHRSREGHRDRSKDQGTGRGITDVVSEGPPDEDSGFLMRGGAGPAGTLPQDTPSESRGLLYSRSPSRSGRRTSDHTPKQGRARAPPSPTRRIGPDGRTPFGLLPNRRAGVGLKDHFRNTYEHIKAEHEQGYRAQTVVEQAVDVLIGKSAGEYVRDMNDMLKRDRRGDRHRKEEKEKSRDGREHKKRHEEGAEHRHNRHRQDGLSDHHDSKPPTPYHPSSGSPSRYHADAAPASTMANRSSSLAHQYGQPYSPDPSPPALRVQGATPPSPLSDHGRAGTSTPTRFDPRIPSVASTGRGAAADYYSPLQTGRMSPGRVPSMSREIPPPPPPPPPGMPPVSGQRHGIIPDQAALFGEIQAGKKLRKVSSSEKRYNSQRASPDRVSNTIPGLKYPETSHSREVEDRERAQASTRTWSTAGDGNSENERMRAFKQGLAAKYSRVSPHFPEASIENEVLTPGDRSQTSVKTDDIAVEGIDVTADTVTKGKASDGQDGVFSGVGMGVDTPSWDWSNLQKGK